jgi:hypothetical protein
MKTSAAEREALIEAATGAYRGRDADGRLIADAAWMDLDEEGRREAYARAAGLRAVEAAMDGRGLSSTGRSVLARIGR